MKPITPHALKKGDTIGVMSPSGYVEPPQLVDGVSFLEKNGYKVLVHPQTFFRHHQSAGTQQEKIDAFHELLADASVNAIFFAGGGNRALQILDGLDYSKIQNHPKIIMGFSDTTSLINAISARTGLITFHGPVLKNIARHTPLGLLDGTAGGVYDLTSALQIHAGQAEGRLIGGNLSVYQYLIGTHDSIDLTGNILFLEECNEEISRVDRMLCHLARQPSFKNLGGIIFGEFLNLQDTGRPFGFTLEDIIREHTAGLNIPVIMNAPFGHGDNLPVFPVGCRARLNGMTLTLLEKPVQ